MSWPQTPFVALADAQANQIAKHVFDTFAKPRGGSVKVMESMWHLWEHILEATDQPRVLVCCTGESPRGPFSEQDNWHRVDRQWTVAIVRGHGFRNLMPNETCGPPEETLTASIEALRDAVRAMTGISEEFPVNYKGWKPLPAAARPGTANVFVAGATLEFSTANDIPEVSQT